MKSTTIKSILLAILFGINSTAAYADAIGTAPASCFKFADYTTARILTWHSPLLHRDPNDYSQIGAKMKVKGLYPRESPWADVPTYRQYASWLAWYYYSTGTPPQSVAGDHRATLALTGSKVGISPTYRVCL